MPLHVEGMHRLAPTNEDALYLLVQSWTGYGFGFVEDDMEDAQDRGEPRAHAQGQEEDPRPADECGVGRREDDGAPREYFFRPGLTLTWRAREQFLFFTGSSEAEIVSSQVANYKHPQHPGFEDFGDCMVRGNGGTGYIRVDWYTPDGLPTWGDGRLTLLGTEGYIELRKYVDLAGRPDRVADRAA